VTCPSTVKELQCNLNVAEVMSALHISMLSRHLHTHITEAHVSRDNRCLLACTTYCVTSGKRTDYESVIFSSI